jgi:predicted metal-binding membrane protein
MGVEHGAFCIGCCWVLMLLLFVSGVMNLVWVAAIAAVVLAEKLFPHGRMVSRIAGAVLIGWGAVVVAGTLAAT